MLRIELLNILLNMNLPVSDIAVQLNNHDWDSDAELVSLTRQHILNVLKKYQEKKINETEVEEWANAIEGREDIGREKFHENVINLILYELANPCLTEKLTNERAKLLGLKLMMSK